MAQLSRINKIAVVGAGPSGIYCAIHLLEGFKRAGFDNFFLKIFDKSQVLQTILPTGNGRCNFTNAIQDIKDFASNYPRGEKFLYSIFSRYNNSDTLKFFNSIGVRTYIDDDLKIFPKSNSAKEVREKLLNKLNTYKNFKIINKQINSVEQIKDCDKIIISAGSRYCEALLKSTNQPFIPFKPSIASLKIRNHIFPQGVSVKALDGDFIFTNGGISGPLAYKISSLHALRDFPYEVEIKLFDYNKLINLAHENPKKPVGKLVCTFIPKSLSRILIKDYAKNACEVSEKDLINFSKIKFEITGVSKGSEIVNCGGVDLKYINKNCKSKINNNLWFCGEVLNIDGFCGGFNLQNCWSSGYIVALDVVKSVMEENKKEN